MSASTNDKITDVRNAARPNSARVTSGRSAGGSTLACDNLSGWPTASKVHFVTYKIDSNSAVVAGTQLDCYGIVSGNNIGSFAVVDGTDTGHAVGDVVEMLPTAAWGQDLADALGVGHTRSGAHVANLPLTTPILTAPAIADFTSATHTHANAAGGGQIANAGISGLSSTKLSNDYKFSVYRNAALTDGNGSLAVMTFDTKTFDTGSNVDIVTNKGRFTAPIAGFYQFNTRIGASITGVQYAILELYKNGVAFVPLAQVTIPTGANNSILSGSVLLQLAANDYIEIYHQGTGGAVTTGTTTSFDGFLVSAT